MYLGYIHQNHMTHPPLPDIYITKAIFESIHLWQRSEAVYAKHIQKAVGDPVIQAEFVQSFSNFLNDYGVRRNLEGEPDDKKTEKPVLREFWRVLKDEMKFFKQLDQACDEFPAVIDATALKLKADYGDLTRNQLILSLLSKVAFMYKPSLIPLMDQLAKEALRGYYEANGKKAPINTYEQFYREYGKFKSEYIEILLKKTQLFSDTLQHFPEWKMKNAEAFLAHRSVDKLLWWVGKFEV